MDHLIIMAGGVGSRFWPMSTSEMPKQFIDVLGTGRTLLQATADRFSGVCAAENTWVVTSLEYKNLVSRQLPHIPQEQILLEPSRQNTAPCVAYVSWKIRMKDPEARLVVTPADHLVTDTVAFGRAIRQGLEFVSGENRILTLGMYPTRPETGFGYIKVRSTDGKPVREGEIREVEAFREKPDLATAGHYLAAGGYYWNAGIFLWHVRTIERAFRKYQPEMAALFDDWSKDFYTPAEQRTIDEHYHRCTRISVDYAILERAENIFVLPARFGWSDLGTWGALYEHSRKDEQGNAVVGEQVVMVESEGCEVHISPGKKIVVQGLKDYIIAENNDVILICRKSDEQRVKEFSEMMEKSIQQGK